MAINIVKKNHIFANCSDKIWESLWPRPCDKNRHGKGRQGHGRARKPLTHDEPSYQSKERRRSDYNMHTLWMWHHSLLMAPLGPKPTSCMSSACDSLQILPFNFCVIMLEQPTCANRSSSRDSRSHLFFWLSAKWSLDSHSSLMPALICRLYYSPERNIRRAVFYCY